MQRKGVLMATKKEITKHLKIALAEIGEIKPWFDKECNDWTFSHPNYPVEYGGKTTKEVVRNYPKYLEEFIRHRLDEHLADSIEKKTHGRGGMRPRAGRPKGSKTSEPTKQIRVPEDIADWIKSPGMIPNIRQILS